MNDTIWNTFLTAEGNAFVNITDKEKDIDLSAEIFCSVRFTIKSVTPLPMQTPSSAQVQEAAADAVTMSYVTVYPHGLSVSTVMNDRPEACLSDEIKRRLNEKLSYFGAVTESFTAENQRLAESDRQMLDSVIQMNELRDPKKAAQLLLQRTLEAAKQWKCDCGRINTSPFCPDCGKASGRWLCTCGRINTSPFCPDCGKPSANGKPI